MTKQRDRLPVEPDAADLSEAWDAAGKAEAVAAELREECDALLFRAYQTGWHVRDIADAVGLDASKPATLRRLYRRLNRPFQRAAEQVAS